MILDPLVPVFACAAAALSAAACYAGSRHGPWAMWQRHATAARWTGALLAVLALASWVIALGVGAGLCAMLGSWMLVAIVLPYATTWARSSTRHDAASAGLRR